MLRWDKEGRGNYRENASAHSFSIRSFAQTPPEHWIGPAIYNFDRSVVLGCRSNVAITSDGETGIICLLQMRRSITVNDRMQRDYRYELVEPVGRNFDPEFKPDLTPAEMLRLGVFGGKYMTDCADEFPASWFKHAKLASGSRDNSLNYFGVEASQPLSEWRRKGWIHPDDPRGWFQWYCRYYMGRRMPDEDARQIRRWKAIRRHVRQLQLACEPGDLSCRRRQRQALLHWAYDSRKL
jgi:hypothetical protein